MNLFIYWVSKLRYRFQKLIFDVLTIGYDPLSLLLLPTVIDGRVKWFLVSLSPKSGACFAKNKVGDDHFLRWI